VVSNEFCTKRWNNDSCGIELDRAREELKEILLPEEYYQLEQKYRYWEPKK